MNAFHALGFGAGGFVVAGGGFSGVEVVAELNDFVRGALRSYRGIDPRELRVVLVHSQDRILPEETTVLCVTGNGLKTTDVLAGVYKTERPIAPKLTEFEAYLQQTLDVDEVPGVIAAAEAVAGIGA